MFNTLYIVLDLALPDCKRFPPCAAKSILMLNVTLFTD